MDNLNVKVARTSEMYAAANNIGTKRDAMQALLEDMLRSISTLNESYASTSGDKYREMYKNVENELKKCLEEMNNLKVKLETATKEWEGYEGTKNSAAGALSGNGIFQ